MPKKSLVAKSARKPKFSTRIIRRCSLCGRKRGFLRFYGLCRICFREKASAGQLPGITKSSW